MHSVCVPGKYLPVQEWEYRLSRGTLNQLQAPIKPGREKLAMSKSAYSGKSFAQLAARDEMVDL